MNTHPAGNRPDLRYQRALDAQRSLIRYQWWVAATAPAFCAAVIAAAVVLATPQVLLAVPPASAAFAVLHLAMSAALAEAGEQAEKLVPAVATLFGLDEAEVRSWAPRQRIMPEFVRLLRAAAFGVLPFIAAGVYLSWVIPGWPIVALVTVELICMHLLARAASDAT